MAEVKLDHVAFGAADVAPVAQLLAADLGGRERSSGPGNGFVFWQWEFAGGGARDLVPDGPPVVFLHRFLERGRRAHHSRQVPTSTPRPLRARAGYEPVGFAPLCPLKECSAPKQDQASSSSRRGNPDSKPTS